MVSRDTLLEVLPPFEGKVDVISYDQSTKDIINEVLKAHDYFAEDYDSIYKFFLRRSLRDTCSDLWEFCKKYIPYRIESTSDQTTKSPAAILQCRTMGGQDCKHYSLFINGVLDAIQRNTGRPIDFYYRFASYDEEDDTPEHVFSVVRDGGTEIWIDPVLSMFDYKYEPEYYEEGKPQSMLTRISGIQDIDYIHESIPQSFLYNEADISPVVENALQILWYYSVVDDNGNLSADTFYSIVDTLPPEESAQLAQAWDIVLHKNSIGNFFDDLWRGVKVVFNSPTRLAFLSLVGLNAFNMAVKFNKAIAIEADRQEIADKWYSAGGNWGDLHKAIQDGARLANQTVINGIVNRAPMIGVTQAVIAAWVALASAIIAALMPVVNAILKKRGQDTGTLSDAQLQAALNAAQQQQGTSGSIMNFIQQNPLPVILIGGAVVYMLMSTKKRRA